jgi:hypothetical protein
MLFFSFAGVWLQKKQKVKKTFFQYQTTQVKKIF